MIERKSHLHLRLVFKTADGISELINLEASTVVYTIGCGGMIIRKNRIATKMLYSLLFLVAVLPFAESSDTESEKHTTALPSNCHVDDMPDVQSQCPSDDSGYVAHGNYCQNKDSSSQTQSYIVMCSNGKWITVPTAPKRIKRWKSAVGGNIAGAVVGGIVMSGINILYTHFSSKGAPPNKPPSITWSKPKTLEYYANPGDTFAVVGWDSPTASDEEDDGSLSPEQISGLPANSKFKRGRHTITYQAKDSKGLTAFDHYTFTVEVRVCQGSLPFFHNGYITCDNYERIAGTTCNYRCMEGYQLIGNAKRKCETNGKFSGQAPRCKIKTCQNSTELYPRHGQPKCHPRTLEYNTMCTTMCEPGYKIPTSGVSLMICQSSGKWSSILPDCKDSEPPTILDCPSTQYVYADKELATAVITWDVPTIQDNSGEAITATQTKGQSPGTNFNLGSMEIRYSATDSAGNTSPDCIFSVRVDQQICDPPNIIDQYMEIDCPEGFSFGSECHLTCRGSYPLIGSDTISCERNTTNPIEVYWYMGTGEIPYCKQNKCPDLVPPIHGALTCDTWMYGVQCMMHCNEKYDIPAGTGGGSILRFTGQFTCSTSSGKWSPLETVPGCTEKRNPQSLYLPGELYYFTGSCNDTITQQKIKANFIKEMQNLQDNGWEGICPNSDDCNVDNVNLKCGAARRRRDLYKTRRTRQINGASVLVTFQIVVKYENYGNNITVTRNQLERKATSLGSLMEDRIQSGSLDVEGAKVEQGSFQTGQAIITCEPGRYPRITTLSCASCPLGSVYDDDLKECTECPKGSYRDDDNVLTCTPCPSGTSTATTGTLNATDCVPICEPGYYSLTGVYPCTPCSRFQYGPHKMATHCEECGLGSMASAFASTNGSDCSVFDAVISGGMLPHTVGTLQGGTGSFTLALWIRIPRRKNLSLNNDVSLHVKIGNGIRIQIGQYINVTLNSEHLQTGIGLNFGSWQHVAVVSNVFSKNIKVFVQGVVQFTSPTLVNVTSSANDVQLSSVGMPETGLRMSGLLLTPTSLDDGDIESLTSTCYHTRERAVTMDGFKHVDSRSITLISPSVCDAEDNCDPNPCHGHVCIEDVDGFICRCGGGFTGDLCQIPPDYCLNHECENGATCNNLLTNYTCLCATGFKGHLCENEIVNGGWSIWSNWSDCSKTCEGGNMARQRECNNPFPDPEGQPCIGEDMETAICTEDPCPACPPPPRSYGNVMDCNYTHDLTTCRVQCRDGLWFAPGYPPLPEYKCGAETAYEWNGKPPSCSEAYIPEKVGTISTVSYSSGDLCDKEKDMKTSLLANAKDKIECVITETCEIDASIEGCSDIFKRSLDEVTVQAVITLEIPLETEEIKKVNVSSSEGPSPTIMNFVRAISALGNSTNQLNTSSEILRIEVDGREYDALSVETHGTVECPEGYIQLEAFCTDCPQGTYNRDSNECTSCPYGTYQDKVGSMSCEECPFGFSTPFLESTDISDCSVPAAVTTTKITVTVEGDSSITGIAVGCIVGALFGCAVIVGVVVCQLRRRKQRRSFQIPDVKYHACNKKTFD